MPDWRAVPRGNRHMLTWSRERAIWIERNLPTADAYFRQLPFRRTLTSILRDRSIWLNYEDNPRRYGATETLHHRDVAISSTAFRKGRWVVLATVIHELAHVGGAQGSGHAAEQAVLACGPGLPSELRRGRDDPRTPYEPGIIGFANPNMEETANA